MTTRSTTPGRLVVVGAGITGLAAAFEWRRRRPDDEIVVLEAGDRIGGKLHRVELAGHWYDTGPEAVLARVPEAVLLVEALGLGGDVSINPSGGPLAGNPMFTGGLIRIGEAARRIQEGTADKVIGHATSGPALQQNLVCVMASTSSTTGGN